MERKAAVVKQITVTILVISFVYSFVNSITSVLINDVIEAFGLTGAAQGLMSSMLSFGLMLALLVNPLFQGRISKITMLLLSGMLQIAALILSGSAVSFAMYSAAMVLLGIGCGWLDGYINSSMIDIHPNDSGKYLGLLHGLFGVGSLLAPVAMNWMLKHMAWRFVHVVIAGLVVTAMAFVCACRKGSRETGLLGKGEEDRISMNQLGSYLKNGRNILLLCTAAMTAALQTGLTCWIVRYMLLAYNNDSLGAACLTVYWITATVNRFIAPKLSAKPLTLIAGGGILAAVLLLGGILSGNAAVMCGCVGLMGLATGHFVPMIVGECAEGYHGNTTLTTAAAMFVMGIARVLIPIIMAAVTEGISTDIGMAIPAVTGVLAAVFCVSLLSMKPYSAAQSS